MESKEVTSLKETLSELSGKEHVNVSADEGTTHETN